MRNSQWHYGADPLNLTEGPPPCMVDWVCLTSLGIDYPPVTSSNSFCTLLCISGVSHHVQQAPAQGSIGSLTSSHEQFSHYRSLKFSILTPSRLVTELFLNFRLLKKHVDKIAGMFCVIVQVMLLHHQTQLFVASASCVDVPFHKR